MKKRGFFFYGKWVVLGIAGIILFTFVVMWLWNWLVPVLFKGPMITYWQTLGLLVLSKILFSGIGGKSHDRHRTHHDHDCSGYRDRWHRKYQEKMNGKVADSPQAESL